MPLETQTRLLRVLSSGEFYRVGGREPIKVDVRIIAATHQKLEDKVLEGEFREDLFHRINVIRINLPKLSDRREDIPQLCRHFFKVSSSELEEELKFLSHCFKKTFTSRASALISLVRNLIEIFIASSVLLFSEYQSVTTIPPL